MVIPHGNTWGFYTPPGTSWDKQLAAHDDPAQREPLFEIFSGHGNSEEYRDFRAVEFDSDDTALLPRADARTTYRVVGVQARSSVSAASTRVRATRSANAGP